MEQLPPRLERQTRVFGGHGSILGRRQRDSTTDGDSSSTDVYTTDEEAETESDTDEASSGWSDGTSDEGEWESCEQPSVLQESTTLIPYNEVLSPTYLS